MKTYEKKYQNMLNFVDEIFESSSIKIDVAGKEYKLDFSQKDVLYSSDNKTRIIKKKSEDRTYFFLDYDGDNFICSVKGISEDVIKQVNLIITLFNNSTVKIESLTVDDFFRSIVYGDINERVKVRFSEKITFPKSPCVCLLLTVQKGNVEEVNSVLNYYVDKKDKSVCLSKDRIALIRFVNDKEEEYRSLTEYASLIVRAIYEETGIKISIYIGGVVKGIYETNTSYLQAVNTLRICAMLDSEENVHNYKEYVFFTMLEDIPKNKLKEYLDAILDYSSLKFFEDKEMVETAECFLENSLNASETSRKLFLHRNTLSYRLDKIEKETGLDIRKFSDALTFRLLMLIKQLLK